MHSSVSLAAYGRNSANRAWEEPNLLRVSEARSEPNACATSSGIVIMRPPNTVVPLHRYKCIGAAPSYLVEQDRISAIMPRSWAPRFEGWSVAVTYPGAPSQV